MTYESIKEYILSAEAQRERAKKIFKQRSKHKTNKKRVHENNVKYHRVIQCYLSIISILNIRDSRKLNIFPSEVLNRFFWELDSILNSNPEIKRFQPVQELHHVLEILYFSLGDDVVSGNAMNAIEYAKRFYNQLSIGYKHFAYSVDESEDAEEKITEDSIFSEYQQLQEEGMTIILIKNIYTRISSMYDVYKDSKKFTEEHYSVCAQINNCFHMLCNILNNEQYLLYDDEFREIYDSLASMYLNIGDEFLRQIAPCAIIFRNMYDRITLLHQVKLKQI